MKRRDFLRLTAGLAIGAPLSSAIASQDLSEQSLEALCSLVERKRLGLYPNKLVVPQALADRARGILARQEWRMEHRRQRFERRLDEFMAWVELEWAMFDGPARAYFDEGDRRIQYDTVALGAIVTGEQLEDGRADGITARSALLRAVREDWERALSAYRAAGVERPRLVWRSRPQFALEEADDAGGERHKLRMRLATPDPLPGMNRSHCCAFCFVKPEGAPALHIALPRTGHA